jgi:hypothetical protein
MLLISDNRPNRKAKIKNIAVFLLPSTFEECSITKANVKKKEKDPIKPRIDIEVK